MKIKAWKTKRGGFLAKLMLGRGAGYQRGATAYIAFRSDSRHWMIKHRGAKVPTLNIEVGVTRNANRVPY